MLSGIGWVLDVGTFSVLVKALGTPSTTGNFISSFVGVTFVYFVSLKTLFPGSDARGLQSLYLYWTFQFVSITFYSILVDRLAESLSYAGLPIVAGTQQIVAKVLSTIPNLITNFIFMKFLTSWMREKSPSNA